MRKSFALVDVALAVVVVVAGANASGCSSKQSVLSAPIAPEPSHATVEHVAGGPAFVVWTRGAKDAAKGDWTSPGPEQSAWLDSDGAIVARANGIVLAEGGRLWRWSVDAKTVPFVTCEDALLGLEGDALRARAHWEDQQFQRASLARVDVRGAGQRREVLSSGDERHLMNLDKNPEGPHVGTFDERITISGSVGPFLFVRDHAHENACGAHGLWFTDAMVIDVRNGQRAILTIPDRLDEAMLEAATTALRERYSDYDHLEPQHVGTEPRVDTAGLHMFHTFIADVPFAYGASLWRSYAVDVEVRAALPPELAPFAEVPPQVSAFAAAHPDLVVGGFTRIEGADVDRLRAAFTDQ